MKNPPWGLGIIVPCALISGCSTLAFFLIFKDDSRIKKLLFVASMLMVAESYLQAIFTPPGSPQKNIKTKFDGWCAKCKAPKPERAHHCRQCKQCVLRMDHHCPWTRNCVGWNNTPHFVRFLFWVCAVNGYGLLRTTMWNWSIWTSNLPAYLIPRRDIWLGVLLIIALLFVEFSVGVLFIRVLGGIVSNQTQIEEWEEERARILSRRRLGPSCVFPFDINPWKNIYECLGAPWTWLLPWGHAPGDGHNFPKAFTVLQRWPPDPDKAREHEYYRWDRWVNYEGENVSDFGVDVQADYTAPDDIPLSEMTNST